MTVGLPESRNCVFAQAYEAARELGAEKIVYHSGLYPDAYLLIGWAERMADFFGEFLEDRRDIDVVVENVFDRTWKPLRIWCRGWEGELSLMSGCGTCQPLFRNFGTGVVPQSKRGFDTCARA